MKGKLVIFSAPSGSGKTTIVRRLLDSNLHLEFSISACTRAPRNGEKHGKDYYFLSVSDFKKKIQNNEFVEWEEVYENQFYGTLKSELERIWKNGNHVAFDIDVKGGVNLKKMYNDRALALFIKPPSIKELENRLRNRGTDKEESIKKRIEKAGSEMTFADKFDAVIINDELGVAVKEAYNKVHSFLKYK